MAVPLRLPLEANLSFYLGVMVWKSLEASLMLIACHLLGPAELLWKPALLAREPALRRLIEQHLLLCETSLLLREIARRRLLLWVVARSSVRLAESCRLLDCNGGREPGGRGRRGGEVVEVSAEGLNRSNNRLAVEHSLSINSSSKDQLACLKTPMMVAGVYIFHF